MRMVKNVDKDLIESNFNSSSKRELGLLRQW